MTVPPRFHHLGALALAALLLSALAGCSDDNSVSGPGMEGLDPRAPATASYADGFVWAFNPAASSYTAAGTGYAYNRSGGTITITRQGTGTYSARFAGLSALLKNRSTVHVTGYGSNSSYCKPAAPTLKNDVIGIKCFDAATGRPADAQYTVYITGRYDNLAFAFANKPTGTNYAPPASASHNPKGAIRVVRLSTGKYTVWFKGLGDVGATNGGHVQVAAVGTGAQHCKTVAWGTFSTDFSVDVWCYSRTGALKDVKFNVFFARPHARLAYAWANSGTSPSYQATAFYSSNPGGGSVWINRSGVGRYVVTWSGLALSDGSDVQVTGFGAGNTICKVESWDDTRAVVRCFDPATGAPADGTFNVMYTS